MSKRYTILLILLLSSLVVKAQISFDPGEGCLNVVDITAGKGVGAYGSDVLSSHYLHERFINEQLSVGAGAGYGYLGSYGFSAIPLYFSTHCFFLDQRFSPFLNLRTGVYFPFGAKSSQPGANLYVAAGAGCKLHITPYVGILASADYDGYLVKTFDSARNDYRNKMASGLGIRIGVCFQIPGW